MMQTVLATDLAAAVLKDEQEGEGFDLSAGLFGPHVSAWIREVAAAFAELSPPSPPGPGELNGLLCGLCGKPQFMTPSGASCPDGHGGVDGYNPSETQEHPKVG